MLNENVEEDNDDDEDDDEDSLFSNSNVHPRCVILFIFTSEFCSVLNLTRDYVLRHKF